MTRSLTLIGLLAGALFLGAARQAQAYTWAQFWIYGQQTRVLGPDSGCNTNPPDGTVFARPSNDPNTFYFVKNKNAPIALLANRYYTNYNSAESFTFKQIWSPSSFSVDYTLQNGTAVNGQFNDSDAYANGMCGVHTEEPYLHYGSTLLNNGTSVTEGFPYVLNLAMKGNIHGLKNGGSYTFVWDKTPPALTGTPVTALAASPFVEIDLSAEDGTLGSGIRLAQWGLGQGGINTNWDFCTDIFLPDFCNGSDAGLSFDPRGSRIILYRENRQMYVKMLNYDNQVSNQFPLNTNQDIHLEAWADDNLRNAQPFVTYDTGPTALYVPPADFQITKKTTAVGPGGYAKVALVDLTPSEKDQQWASARTYWGDNPGNVEKFLIYKVADANGNVADWSDNVGEQAGNGQNGNQEVGIGLTLSKVPMTRTGEHQFFVIAVKWKSGAAQGQTVTFQGSKIRGYNTNPQGTDLGLTPDSDSNIVTATDFSLDVGQAMTFTAVPNGPLHNNWYNKDVTFTLGISGGSGTYPKKYYLWRKPGDPPLTQTSVVAAAQSWPNDKILRDAVEGQGVQLGLYAQDDVESEWFEVLP